MMNLNYSHLPKWLEKNWLFRKLFLLRKLFLTRTRFYHHGQAGEDIYISRQFPKGYKGFFVDVGCFHPTKYNNTFILYKRGWRGINIDINRIKIEAFNFRRPKDTNIQVAVSHKTGESQYWINGFYSLVNTLSNDFKEERSSYDYRQETVQTDTLTNIIDNTGFKDRAIDFLNVDTEGHDLVVLQSLNFERYKPYLIAVEIQKAVLDEIMQTPMFTFLQQKGYTLVNWKGQTLMFKHTGDPRFPTN